MDDMRFDDLTRHLGASRSRRQTFKFAAGGLLAALVGLDRAEIASAAICRNRVPNPDHVPSSNGCGTAAFPVSGRVGTVDFTPACNHHDLCYDTCNSVKSTCDSTFKNEMRAICVAGYPKGGQGLRSCYSSADLYYSAVAFFGSGAYDAAQQAACICVA